MKRLANLALVWIITALPASAEEIRNEQHRYTVKVPQGWQIMPAPQLQALMQASPARTKFDYGFVQPEGSELTYALLMTITDNVSRYTMDELEKSLARDLNVNMIQKKIAEENLENMIKDVKMGTAYIDRDKKRVVINMDMNVMGMAKLRCLGFGMLGKNSVTFLYCYGTQDTFTKLIPSFEKLADSFAYDADQVYVEPSGWMRAEWFQGGIRGGIIGGLAGGGVALLMTIFKKKKPKPEQAV